MKFLWPVVIFVLLSTLNGVDLFYYNVFNDWKAFKAKYNKEFQNKYAEQESFGNFLKNWLIISKHNSKYDQESVSYKLAINHLADIDSQMLPLRFHGLNKSIAKQPPSGNSKAIVFMTPENVSIPDFVNWTAEGAVTSVKNQEYCRSGWAFAATGALEGQLYRLSKKLTSLSEQNLIDCSWDYGNNGCIEGWTEYAFEYVSDNGGIDTETSYPYDGEYWDCRYNPETRGATAKAYVEIPHGDEMKLMEAVATVGPIAIAINDDDLGFQLYKEGIYTGKPCTKGECINHAMLVVGYGTDPKTGLDYWLAKNSWGRHWGERGFIKMVRNRNNSNCIASFASYPLL